MAYVRQRNTGLTVIKRAFGYVALAIGCFLFGFLVLSRHVPVVGASEAGASAAVVLPPSRPDGAAEDDRRVAQAPPQMAPHPAVRRSATGPGPSIEPESSVQAPSSVDTPAPGPDVPAPAGDMPALAPTDRPHRRHHRRDDAADTQTPTTADGSAAPADAAAAPSTDDAAAAKPDTGNDTHTDAPAATDAAVAPDVKPHRYRVQAGIYSTQDAADRQAGDLRDKGFPSKVQAYDQDGRTLYRVQTGVFRDKARADNERKRLSDAGFDVTVIERD